MDTFFLLTFGVICALGGGVVAALLFGLRHDCGERIALAYNRGWGVGYDEAKRKFSG